MTIAVTGQLLGAANVTASNHTILVLWGQGFDEIAASIFIGELRRMGKRVKLVGLNHQHLAGQHGLTLVPDLLLGQALAAAKRVHCIIVPAPWAALQQFSYDPRLAELLGMASANQALVVANTLPAANPPDTYSSDTHAPGTHAPGTHTLDAYPLDAADLPLPAPFTPLDHTRLLTYPALEDLLPFVQTELAPRLARA